MRLILLPILILTLSVLAIGDSTGTAESTLSPDHITIHQQYHNQTYIFQVDPVYNYNDAYAGANLSLTITVTTDNSNKENLVLDDCAPEGDSSLIKIDKKGSDSRTENGLLVTDYFFNVKIDPGAQSRQYGVNLELRYPGQEKFYSFFKLKVYRKINTEQTIANKDEKDEDAETPTLYTGETNTYELALRNSFSDYHIKVMKVSVESPGKDLIEPQDNALVSGPISLGPNDEEPKVKLSFNVKSMSFTNLVMGFGDNPKLKLTLIYVDEYGRKTTETPPAILIKIRPHDHVLILAMLMGVLIGGLIRFYLEFLARRKKITRREMLKFVLYTVIFGLVVTAFAFLGQIQISAFKASGSYDRPLALFIIGLAGAVGGLQLFVGWYNSLKPATENNKGEEKT
jgi:hypothetical protein